MANTPWGLWTAARREKKDMQVAHGTLSATMDDNKRQRVNEHMKGKEQQRLGHSVPQGAQLTKLGSVPCCMSDILRGPTDVLGGTARAAYLAKVRKEGKAEPGDGVRRVREKPGQGELAGRRVDIPPQRY